jgi:4-aminobutyrate aminotransferase/(S)-3-amino-2-methylpropionate transaminase
MPIAAVLGKAHVMDAAAPSTLGGTYAGNPLCCAASLATLNYMEDININALGEKVGSIVRNRFDYFQKKYPSVVGEVRGLGAMLAFDVIYDGDLNTYNSAGTQHIINTCAERGLIVISAGVQGNVIRILSPLVIEDELLEKGLDILEGVIKEL